MSVDIKEIRRRYGNEFRRWRKANKLTLGQVARALDVPVTYVSDIELGRRDPEPSKDPFVSIVKIPRCPAGGDHDPRPYGDGSWARCMKCGDGTFPNKPVRG